MIEQDRIPSSPKSTLNYFCEWEINFLYVLIFFIPMLGIKPRALPMLHKHFTTELHTKP
jgi:hypothetical protein